MKSRFLGFLSRFRKAPQRPIDPTRLRTMAQSEVEDHLGDHPETPERRVYDEASFEKGQEALHQGFGTSTHSGDNPLREDDLKNMH